MALLDDINRLLRDHTGYTGDGQGGSGPLPVGDRSTARFPINKRDLRELLIGIAQAMGDPGALQDIIDELGDKADIANSGKVFNTRAAAVNAGQEVLPGTLGLIATREGDYIVYRAPGLTADDPLFATAPRWGVMLRVPSAALLDDKADNSDVAALSEEVAGKADSADLEGKVDDVGDEGRGIGASGQLVSPTAALVSDVRGNIALGVHGNDGSLIAHGPDGEPITTVGDAERMERVAPVAYKGSGAIIATNERGQVVLGLSPAGGLIAQDDAGNPVGGAASSMTLHVIRSDDDLSIHIPTLIPGRYISWAMGRRESVEKVGDVWSHQNTAETQLVGQSYVPVETIVRAGQTEIAIQKAGDTGFNIGGDVHGSDMLTDVYLLVDGVQRSLDTPTEEYRCDRIEIAQTSQMYDTDRVTPFAKRYTRWIFDRDGMRVRTRLMVEGTLEIATLYLAMLTISRVVGATQVTSAAARSPLWEIEDVSGTHSRVNSDSAAAKVWGGRYGIDMNVTAGWDHASRQFWISSELDRNKLYWNFGPRTTAPGEVITSEFSVNITARAAV